MFWTTKDHIYSISCIYFIYFYDDFLTRNFDFRFVFLDDFLADFLYDFLADFRRRLDLPPNGHQDDLGGFVTTGFAGLDSEVSSTFATAFATAFASTFASSFETFVVLSGNASVGRI